MLSHKVIMKPCNVTFDSMTVWRVNFSSFSNAKKYFFFNISPRAQLAYKSYPIKFYREWPNLNTVNISYCKVAVSLVKFAIKGLEATEKHQNKVTIPILSTL